MNLKHKFILVLLSMIVSVVAILTYINLQKDTKIFNVQLENRVSFMKKQMLQNAKYTIHHHKDEIENNLASMNLSSITQLLKQLLKRENIEGVALVSKNNDMQLFEGRPLHKMVKEETVKIHDHSVMIATPIILSEYWGTFSIAYSLGALKSEMMKAKEISQLKQKDNIDNAIILALSIFIVFGVFIFYWAKRLTRPILLLTHSAQKMADGELDENEELLHIDRNDEIGALAKTFQKMSVKLEHSYKELQELNENLESKIKARTHDLEKSKEALKVLASIDPMTKLYNRRYFAQKSEEIFAKNKKNHKNLSLIMLDIDNFKNVNDTYGHHVGDKVIIAVADILLKHTRKTDIVCRYGGEEYMILLSETSIKRCIEIAEIVRIDIENLVIKLERGSELNVTISIGISMADMLVDTHVEIGINKADNALYEAKRGGKNKVVLYAEKVLSQ